jgi:hypothetical protein
MRLKHVLKTGQFDPERYGHFHLKSDGQIETKLDGQFRGKFQSVMLRV